MLISNKIIHVASQTDFALWAATVGIKNEPYLTRVSGFKVVEDKEHIRFFLPAAMFDFISPSLNQNTSMSFLMASLSDFESYQLKGMYDSHRACTEKEIDYYRLKVLKIIDILNGMGMDGNGVFGHLLEQPSIAVKMSCTEMYAQTPKQGTGGKLKD